MGTFSVSADDVLVLPESDDHRVVIQGELTDDDGKKKGQIEACLILERGEDWDWFVQQCQDTFRKNNKLAHEKELLSRGALLSRPAQHLNFPLQIEVQSLVLFDFASGSWGFRESISLISECGEQQHSGQSKHVNTFGEASWEQLAWNILVPLATNSIVITVCGHRKNQGKCIITGLDILHHTNTSALTFEVAGDVVDYSSVGESLAGIKFILKGRIDNGTSDVKEDIPVDSVGLEDHHSTLQLPCLVLVSELDVRLSLNLASRLKASYVALVKQGGISPLLHIEVICGYRRFTSGKCAVTKSNVAGSEFVLKLTDLKWRLPVKRDVALTFNVFLNDSKFGSVYIFSNELEGLALSSSKTSVKRYVYSDQALLGRVLLMLSVEHNGDTSKVENIILKDTPIISPVLIQSPLKAPAVKEAAWSQFTVLQSAAIDGVTGTSLTVQDVSVAALSQDRGALKGDGSNLFSGTTMADMPTSFKLVFVDVLLTDVRNMHYLTKNSLSVTVASGTEAFVTSTQKNVGRHCCWNNIRDSLEVRSGNTVKICVKSNSSIVGECNIPSVKFITTQPNEAGLRDLLITYGSESQPSSGKGKLSYFIETRTELTVPTTAISFQPGSELGRPVNNFDKSASTTFVESAEEGHIREFILPPSNVNTAILQDILFPNLLVIYHVSFMDIPGVHSYSKNSPYLKLRYWSPRIGMVEYVSSVLANAGGFGKWMNLVWEVILSASNALVLLQVVSDSILVAEGVIKASDLLDAKRPNQYGIIETDIPLFLEEDPSELKPSHSLLNSSLLKSLMDSDVIDRKQRRGMIRLAYTSEPYVWPDDELEYDMDSEALLQIDNDNEAKTLAASSVTDTLAARSVGEIPSAEDPFQPINESALGTASNFQQVTFGVLCNINVHYCMFSLVGRIKRHSSESIVNVQLVCNDNVFTCQVRYRYLYLCYNFHDLLLITSIVF
ncbi:hypothetical protein EON65_01900 [archaeon]|nr:MAG: hypothetical protein EON65_01900 [archaeon]